jgi:AraC-like DNA-binding protein
MGAIVSLDLGSGATPPAAITAWHPAVPGIVEVFHARFVDHAYPLHTHDTWTVLIVDDGAIRYDLDHHAHGAIGQSVTILPPHVAHDGRAATSHGFRKRVLYLDASVIGEEHIGAAVDQPSFDDTRLRSAIHRLHGSLADADPFEAECRLALVSERLRARLGGPAKSIPSERTVAEQLRDLLDASFPESLALADAARALHRHPAHLVRSFRQRFGLPPHRYVTGRRIDLARRLLLDGEPAASVAAVSGFADQAHLHRHFLRHLGTTPGRFAVSGRRSGRP